MSYVLLPSSAFKRASRRYLKRNPSTADELEEVLQQLADDPFHPLLKTHRLKGELRNSWACSAGYDLRIIFSFVKHLNAPAILLETVGTHDEVY
jgi:mRNA interferase YafQ